MKNILLLHGAIGSSEQLKPLATLLQSHYNPLLINFSGHGGKKFQKDFNIPQFAEDVIQFLDENNIKSIDVFGYSMGGYVAFYLAKNYSNRIGKVMTLGTKFSWNPEIAVKETKMLNAEKIAEKIPAFAEILHKRHYPIDWKLVLSKTSQMMIEMGDNNPLKIKDYQNIKQQVKIGLAVDDEMVSKEETMEVFNALPHSTFYSLPNSKHLIEKVEIKTLTEEIVSFLR